MIFAHPCHRGLLVRLTLFLSGRAEYGTLSGMLLLGYAFLPVVA
jgi:hypothetical protein